MILSKRERYVSILVAVVVGAWALDHYVLTPLIDRKSRISADVAALDVDLEADNRLLKNQPRVRATWNSMVTGGLKPDVSASESQVINAIADWAENAGLAVSSLKPERTEKLSQPKRPAGQPEVQPLHQTTFRATATGSMSSISRFLFNLQRAKMPIRITDLQLSSRKEGVDDLSLQLGISTIFLPPEKADAAGNVVPGPLAPPRSASTSASATRQEVER